MKFLSLRQHGYLDYLTVLIFALAPTLLGLTGYAALLAYVLAGVHLTMSLLTDMPLGLVKVIPIQLHEWVERIVGPVLIIIGFVPAIANGMTAHLFFVVMGIVILLVGLVTRYR